MTTEATIDSFCRTHRARLCAIARSRGLDEHAAQDAVQNVFLRLLQRDRLIAVSELPTPEHQAAHLTLRLHRELHHRWRAGQQQRRGRGILVFSLSDDAAAFREPSHRHTGEWHLNVAWVNEVIEHSFTRLRRELKPAVWDALEPALRKADHGLGALSGSIRVALGRARRRLRDLLTTEVEGAVSADDAVRELLAALQSDGHA